MSLSLPKIEELKANPAWASLPLFDRKGWKKVRFGDVVHNVNDTERNPAEAGIDRFIGLEHLAPEDLHIKSWGNVADGTTFTRRCRPSQVLFGKRRAYQRKVAVAEFDAVVSGDIYVLAPKDAQLLPELLSFICMADRFFEYAVGTSAGSLSPRTNWKSLATFEFDLPPLDQQRRIAEILWAIDESAVKWGEVQGEAGDYLSCIRDEHFVKTTSEGTVPLKEIGKWTSGNTPPRSNEQFWHGDLPWVSPKDMKVSIIENTLESLTNLGWEKASRVPEGSILIVVRGMILAHTFPVAVAGNEVAFNQDMKALVVSDEYQEEYIFNWFQWAAPSLLRSISESSHGTKRLTTDVLFSRKVPKIEIAQQHEFLKTVRATEVLIKKAEDQVHQTRALGTSILNQIFR